MTAAPVSENFNPLAYNTGNIITQDPRLIQTIKEAEKLAPTGVPILISGERGTGKDLLAHHIHKLSGRGHKPLVIINCAEIDGKLAASQFFGHARGAFTDAHKDHVGFFQRANDGMIFLDEIGELSLIAQAMLLRVMQNGEYTKVGGEAASKADFFTVAATNRNLKEMVEQGSFRADLYDRLAGTVLTIPPLRDRHNDIELLASHFIKKATQRHTISQKAMRMLMQHNWPGNVRQLEHAITVALALTEYHSLEIADFRLPVSETVFSEEPDQKEAQPTLPNTVDEALVALVRSGLTLEQIKQEVIVMASKHYSNDTEVARRLEIGRNTVLKYKRDIPSRFPSAEP